MDCYLSIDDLSPPATPPSSSTSTSSTTTTCSQRRGLLGNTDTTLTATATAPTSATDMGNKVMATKKETTIMPLDMIAHVKTAFRHLTATQKQQFLAELIGCCDTTLLAFINTLVAPKLKVDFFRLLPTELSLQVLSYIDDPYTLAQASQVSSAWHAVLMDETIWKGLCYQHHYHPPSISETSDTSNDILAVQQPSSLLQQPSSLLQQQQIQQSKLFQHMSLSSLDKRRSKKTKIYKPPSSPITPTPVASASTSSASSSASSSSSSLVLSTKSSIASSASSIHTLPSYKSFFRRQYQIDMAWNNGGAQITACPNDIGNALVTSLQMDEEFIVVGCDNNRIEVFDATTGSYLRTLRGHHGGVWALQFVKTDSHCILVSGGCDRDARVWNLRTGQLYHTLQGHSSTIRCLKIRDSKTAVTGSRDASLRIWDIEHGRLKHLCLGHHSSVRCLDVRGDLVVSGSYDGTARLWQIETGECLFVCRGHQSQIYAVAFDDTRIVTGSLDSTIKVWSIAEGGKCIATLHGHTTLVGHLQLLPDLLISGGSDGCLRFWNLTTFECKHRISAHDNSVTCLQVDGKHVLSGGSDGSVKLFDLNSGQLVRSFTQPGRTVWKLECHATKAVVVIQRRLHRDQEGTFHTAIELHDFDHQL
ncbi:hypothetical protein [Absidia glauca]|uniref:F-box domain-containing protein n=1 Tax=Absidia glauca TaxID=4829 RepID=A0A163JVG1_ABSGL|nr:hypothetical protein [Absidia glauca]